VSAPNVEIHVDQAFAAFKAGKHVHVRGAAGSGRRTLAEQLVARDPSAIVVELLEAHEADAVPAAVLPIVAALGAATDRRQLVGGMGDGAATARQALEILGSAGRPIIVSVPGSWRFMVDAAVEDDVPSDHAGRLLQAFGTSRGPMLFLTDASRTAVDFGFTPEVELSLEPQRVTLSALEELWGCYAPHAERLASSIRPDARANAMVWRLAVGALALGVSMARVRSLCERRMAEAISPLATEVATMAVRRGLGAAISRVLLSRRPIPVAELSAVSHITAEHLPLFSQCIGYGDPVRFSTPVRAALQAALRSAIRPSDEEEHHCDLARFHRRFDGVADPADAATFDKAVAWVERVHHLAHAGERGVVEWNSVSLPAPEFYWDRGRALSRRGLHREAAAVYDRGRREFPTDDYCHHYFAWNLEQAEQRTEVVRDAYQRAVVLRPDHPWWNARLIQHLIRTKDAKAARKAWLTALENVDPDGSEVARSPYIPEHLHLWVAQEWLKSGQWQAAKRTIDAVPVEIRAQSKASEFAKLAKEIKRVQSAELRRFSTWIGGRTEGHWATARSWWTRARKLFPALPPPVALNSVEGGAQLAWSLPSLYVEIEIASDDTMSWYASERHAEMGKGEGEEGIAPGIPAALGAWLERVVCA
jgi:tetratricopeptide (TPR) repeat protein